MSIEPLKIVAFASQLSRVVDQNFFFFKSVRLFFVDNCLKMLTNSQLPVKLHPQCILVVARLCTEWLG